MVFSWRFFLIFHFQVRLSEDIESLHVFPSIDKLLARCSSILDWYLEFCQLPIAIHLASIIWNMVIQHGNGKSWIQHGNGRSSFVDGLFPMARSTGGFCPVFVARNSLVDAVLGKREEFGTQELSSADLGRLGRLGPLERWEIWCPQDR